MSLYSKSLTGGSSPTPVFTNTTIGSNGALQDNTVQLLKAGSPVGSNKALAANVGHLPEHRHLRQFSRSLGHDLDRRRPERGKLRPSLRGEERRGRERHRIARLHLDHGHV